MKRETSNLIRAVLEDWLPPVLRDSALFGWATRAVLGQHANRFVALREAGGAVDAATYDAVYAGLPRVHAGTDNSEGCIRRVLADVTGASLCDVGCGEGGLLHRIAAAHPELALSAADFQPPAAPLPAGTAFHRTGIERLPFADAAFDTVTCTHTLEHILDLPRAIAELRRITRRRLIVIVPREREYRHTFNPHLHFFPYRHSLLRALHPLPARFVCEDIGRDIYYREDRD